MQSEAIDQLANALAKAQTEIKGAAKVVENTFFKSKYADLASVWDAWQEVGPKNDLAITQTTRIEGTATILVTQISHKSGQWMRGEYPIQPTKADPQGMGSAVTYARRYCLSAMVGIAPDDDDGEKASGRDTPTNQTKAPPKQTNVERQAQTAVNAAADWVSKSKVEVQKLNTAEEMAAWWKAHSDRIGRLEKEKPGLYDDFCSWWDHHKAELSIGKAA